MEQVSTYARGAIDMLLSVHALACMSRSGGRVDKETLEAAARWMPQLESQIESMKREFENQGVKTNV